MLDLGYQEARSRVRTKRKTKILMRFFADGPNIPDELLEARDQGNVVFLCGAGVSIPAGMPSFLGLAKSVIDELGVPPNAHLRSLLSYSEDESVPEAARPSLDQIFNLLQREYQASEIDYFIAKRLRTRPQTCVSTHRTVLRLSRSADGKPQVVTTNFDLLFQYADKGLAHYVPPVLPDLASGQSLNGLVYLHGRINSRIKRGEARQGFVLSSSDFGRAYLAEGWATQFVRDLLDRYIVVLLGYSANDPPVEYLLQGLQASERERRDPIFAFVSRSQDFAQSAWSDRGVTALTYPSPCGDHSALWNTLDAWAERADDPPAWRQRIVEVARRGPRDLERHERGQVTSLVNTFDGAKVFADADPSPPSEWLCVFDRNVRHAEVERRFNRELPNYDPLDKYGLDDDPPRLIGNRDNERPPGDDFLGIRAVDPRTDRDLRLAGKPGMERIPLPPRLFQLARWIIKVAHEPVALWWAARYEKPHPTLVSQIKWRLTIDRDSFPPLARSVWRLLFEKYRNSPDDNSSGSLYKVKRRIKAEGWTNDVLREFERNTYPFLEIESLPGSRFNHPPKGDWDELMLSDIAVFQVGFPRVIDIGSDVPDDVLPAVYGIARKQLEMAVGLLEDAGPSAQTRTKIYLENKMGGSPNNPSIYFEWFRKLLNRMMETCPDWVRADIELWPQEDTYFFLELRLHAWGFGTLFSGDEIAVKLLSLSHETFWEDSCRSQLLPLLRKRWQDIPQEGRSLLEKRVVQGPLQWASESEEEYDERRSLLSATILGWLNSKGCALSKETLSELLVLRAGNPHWHPDLDRSADEPLGKVRGGRVSRDDDASMLVNAPVSKIISLAQANTYRSLDSLTDFRPFVGLVKESPRKAMAVLTREARHGCYPTEYWRHLLEEWPNAASSRLTWLLGARIARLPSEIMLRLCFYVFSWVEEHFPKLVMMDRSRAWSVLDEILEGLFAGGDDATRSTKLVERVAEDSQGWSRRTIAHAESGPVGRVARLLIDVLESWNLQRGTGVPTEFRGTFERLVKAPGEGADHAVCVIADRFEFLFRLDPEWTRYLVVPWFAPDHPCAEPAWNGLLRRHFWATPELLSLLKTHFLGVFGCAKSWKWYDNRLRVLHEFLVQGCLLSEGDVSILTFAEVRLALQQTSDSGRLHTIQCLADLIANNRNQVNWHDFGKRFLDEAWPKEIRLQTEETSVELARLAGATGDSYPEVVQTILPRLIQIYGDSWFLYRVVSRGSEKEFELAKLFPEATLALVNKLVPDNPPETPFDLNSILEKIAEAKPGLRQDWRWRRLKGIARQE